MHLNSMPVLINGFIQKVKDVNVNMKPVAVVRSMLAFALLIDLMFNPAMFFSTGKNISISIFNIPYPFSIIIAVCIIAWVISGYFPWLSCLFQWWLSFSMKSVTLFANGGNYISSNMCLLLIPACFALPFYNQWIRPESNEKAFKQFRKNLFSIMSIETCRLQVAVVYLFSAVEKARFPGWRNGTALYEWMHEGYFSADAGMQSILNLFIQNKISGMIFCYSIIVFECLLAAALFFNNRWKRILLFAGIAFHILIAILFGLASFTVVMIAVLVLYLYPYKRKAIIFYS